MFGEIDAGQRADRAAAGTRRCSGRCAGSACEFHAAQDGKAAADERLIAALLDALTSDPTRRSTRRPVPHRRRRRAIRIEDVVVDGRDGPRRTG